MTNLEKFVHENEDLEKVLDELLLSIPREQHNWLYRAINDSLTALLAEIEKGVKELKGLPDFEDYAVARKDVLDLLHPSEPKEEEKCDTASDTDYPCDLPKGHEGECRNEYARG